MGNEKTWVVPCAAIAIGITFIAACLTFLTGFTDPPPVRQFGVMWFSLMIVLSLSCLGLVVAKLLREKEAEPLLRLRQMADENREYVTAALAGFALTGLLQIGFTWMKPQLSILNGFWADEIFAQWDVLLLGRDGWLLADEWFGIWRSHIDVIYHLWYSVLVLSLFGVLVRQPSTEKARAVVSYFLLWGVFGTVGQLLLSSAGPIYFERIGLGDRYAGLLETLPPKTYQAQEYLWTNFLANSNAIAIGISAMPSMHVAMGAWIALAYWRTKLAPVALAYWIIVWIGSVLLGWHYFVDGLIGSLGAVLCWFAAPLTFFRRVEVGQAAAA